MVQACYYLPMLSLPSLQTYPPLTAPMVQACYYLPPSANVNPKALVLYTGDGSSYYPTGLSGGGTDKPLPAEYQAE